VKDDSDLLPPTSSFETSLYSSSTEIMGGDKQAMGDKEAIEDDIYDSRTGS
jgi:hypothetical protein